ncbi:MAG TPA: hypothetical protein PLJ12_01835 [Planctomycetota bacterium]|nr:hypothetical protein [Planctomycetota bacterium]
MRFPKPIESGLGGLLAASSLACHAPTVTAGLAVAQMSSRGSFGATESGNVVSTDMDSLGLAQTESALLPRLYLRDGPRLVELSGFAVDLEGTGTVEADITINGTTLAANTDVRSQFSMGSYSGVLTWDVARVGPTMVGLGVGVEWVSLDVGLQETSGSLSLSSEQQFPIPLVGLRISSEEAPVSAHLAVGWIQLQTPEVKASVLDVDGRLEATLFGRARGLKVQGMVGYRGFDLDVGYDDGASQVAADFKIGGPYAGLRIRF